MKPYDHSDIEASWQKKWEDAGLYKATENSAKKKFYSLIEFPFPNAEGLHVGHIRSNTAMDIISRKRRMEGYEVLYPIGWDAFGLPVENFAIKTGIQPVIVTQKNTDTFRKQLKQLGFSFDWSREINTTDPKYYRWTQWIFLQLLKKGLAYKKKMTINWCPKDLIGLANEEVVDGKCERCGTPVEKKEKEQWMLAITKYADRLDKDLDTVDFQERIKIQQRNWIGRSEGAEIEFSIKGKMNFVLLHGFTATPDDDFHPWLKKQLEKAGYSVQVPQLPNTDKPAEDEQVNHVLNTLKFDADTVLLGHSLGSVVALKVLEKLGTKIAGLVTVGGFIDAEFKDHDRNFDKTFKWHFDFEKIKSQVGFIKVLHDVNDVAITDAQAQRLADALNVKVQECVATDSHFTANEEPLVLEALVKKIKVFTTRPDTLFGVTYIVFAPEHPMVNEFLSSLENRVEVQEYVEKIKKETDIERTNVTKDKTGVQLKGVTTINPANQKEIPVWIADYVLADYGTGAVMAVPAHDERDFEFAKKYGLPVKQVIEPIYYQETEPGRVKEGLPFEERQAIIAIVKHWSEEKYIALKWKQVPWTTLITGGIEKGQTPEEAAINEIREETGYLTPKLIDDFGIIHGKFYHVPKKVNRFAHSHTFLFKLDNDTRVEVSEKEKAIHEVTWLTAEELGNSLTAQSHMHAIRVLRGIQNAYVGEGILKDSGAFNGKSSDEVMKAITEAAGGKWVTTYKLRDWIFSRQRYWGEPIPVVHCKKCGIVPVPEKDLPVTLPAVENYKPTETGESPLAAISEWVNTTCPECGGPAKRETDTMPNWAGSSWYYLRYTDPHNEQVFADAEKLKYWTPVDWYNGGMEHTTLHLLYSRFWHKFLFDLGLVPTAEPYAKRTSHGLILAAGGEKMSKSKGNVINPDDIVKNVGADSLRVYEMFMGPFDQSIVWNTDNIAGPRRFIEKIWRLAEKVARPLQGGSPLPQPREGDREKVPPRADVIDRALHKAIKKVSDDIESMGFNTAISTLMITVNELEKSESLTREQYEILLKLLAPFAPHVAEELWAIMGNTESIHVAPWPIHDPALVSDSQVKIVVQVNGKVRGSFMSPVDADKAMLEKTAQGLPEIGKWLEGKTITKTIVVPGRLVSFVAG